MPLGSAEDPTRRAVRALARRIVRAPLKEAAGTMCRAVRAEYLDRIPPEPLYYRGSEEGRRYTPRGGPAGLYLARDQPTAFAEIRDLFQGPSGEPLPLNPADPVTLVYVNVDVDRVLDLTDPDVRDELKVTRKAIRAEWEAPMLEYLAGRGEMPLTQRIGEAAHMTEAVRGILYPSARWKKGICLVVFPDRLGGGRHVTVHDSSRKYAQSLPPSGP